MTEAPQILLNHHLKTLKLPTFLREYEKQARQCATEGLDHVQFLARLVEMEMIDRERRMIERRIKAAKFPAAKSLDSFDFKAMNRPGFPRGLFVQNSGGFFKSIHLCMEFVLQFLRRPMAIGAV